MLKTQSSPYPYSYEMMDLAYRLGLLVIDETPRNRRSKLVAHRLKAKSDKKGQ